MENKSIENLSNIIKDLYAIELIFMDLKLEELNINWNDEKFIIPYENDREYLKGMLFQIYNNEKHFNRIYSLIIREAEKTLRNNSQNIDRLIEYSVKLATN